MVYLPVQVWIVENSVSNLNKQTNRPQVYKSCHIYIYITHYVLYLLLLLLLLLLFQFYEQIDK